MALAATGKSLEELFEEGNEGGALAGGQIVDQSAPPVEFGHIHPGLRRDEGGAEGTEYPVERSKVRSGPRSEALEHVEGVEL